MPVQRHVITLCNCGLSSFGAKCGIDHIKSKPLRHCCFTNRYDLKTWFRYAGVLTGLSLIFANQAPKVTDISISVTNVLNFYLNVNFVSVLRDQKCLLQTKYLFLINLQSFLTISTTVTTQIITLFPYISATRKYAAEASEIRRYGLVAQWAATCKNEKYIAIYNRSNGKSLSKLLTSHSIVLPHPS